MKIVLATPLYPPDIAEPAPYVKELAKRLAQNHEVTIVAYGRLPEKIEGVKIEAIDKRAALPIRLTRYFFRLIRVARDADVIYAQNGSSVELPVALATFFVRAPLVIGIGDIGAHERARVWMFRGFIERLFIRRARSTVREYPRIRPEIMPFGPRPEAALTAWESSWREHVDMLNKTFSYGA